MSAILTPVGLLLIILAGYLFKRFGLFGQKDYRVLQTAEFNIVLPGAIVYSFATNPHDISLLLISVFAFLFAFIPVVFIFLATRKRNVTDRAFLMLNGAGFNLVPLLAGYHACPAFDAAACVHIESVLFSHRLPLALRNLDERLLRHGRREAVVVLNRVVVQHIDLAAAV